MEDAVRQFLEECNALQVWILPPRYWNIPPDDQPGTTSHQ